jgi:tetratricopeptide (TPR) repeat protein
MDTKKLIIGLLIGYCYLAILPVHAQEATASLEEKTLKVYGDSVKFTATINVEPHRVMKKEGYYRIMPELGDIKFPEVHIPSSELQNAHKEGINVRINSSALFDEDMMGNDLEIESEYVYKDGRKNREFNDMDDLAECCITLGTLYSLNGQYELMSFDYTPARSAPMKVVAQINFPINIAEFPVTENHDKVKVIGNYLKTHPDAKITVRGFASPEGPVERNQTLAQERAQAAKEWLVNSLNEKGYQSYLNKNTIKTETTSEDWKGFVQLVRNSNMPQEKQTEILNAVSTTQSLEQTEDKLYNIVGNYEAVKEFMRPLRRATIVVASKNAFREGYTTDQIDSINSQILAGDLPVSSLKDVFNQEEYLQAYVRNNSTQGKITMLTSYNKVYPEDVRVYSDLGALTAVDLHALDVIGGDDALVGVGFNRDAVDIDTELDIDRDKVKFKYKYKEEDVKDPEKFKLKIKADLDQMKKAKIFFDRAIEANSKNFVALNNLGAWHLTLGNYEAAKKYLERSYSFDQSQQGVNYNLGVLNARMGNYEKALEHFNKAGDVTGMEYNRGIARYQAGDYRGAQQDFIRFSNEFPEYAIGHYLGAAAAAQTGDEEIMLEKLRMAIQRDRDLADIAAEDLAFQAYWDDDDFEDASDDDLAER